jgi:hypothetical protein
MSGLAKVRLTASAQVTEFDTQTGSYHELTSDFQETAEQTHDGIEQRLSTQILIRRAKRRRVFGAAISSLPFIGCTHTY